MHQRLPAFTGYVIETPAKRDSGIVDEHIGYNIACSAGARDNATPLLRRQVGGDRCHQIIARNVEHMPKCAIADVRQHEPAARRLELPGHLFAESAAGARDQHEFVVEVGHLVGNDYCLRGSIAARISTPVANNKNMDKEADIRWLVVGAAIGLTAAAWGILRQSTAPADLPDSAVASVNETLIARDIYERALTRVTTPESQDTRAAILNRLVEDELLVQRGVELGMTESDSEVRAAIVNSMVASVTAEADAANPEDDVLLQYLADNQARFSYTAALSVDAWQTNDEPVAQDFVTRLRADEDVTAFESIETIPDMPTGLAPTESLRDFQGPAITAAAAEMPIGSSAVFARRGRWLVVRVNEKENAVISDLDPIRNRVLLDYRRNLADQMLTDYLDGLRQRADIRVIQP